MKKLYWLLAAKIGLLLIISSLSDKIVVFRGFFAYPELLKEFGLPKFIYSFANFDGAHYIKIAREGYHQFDQAFFPLYPLSIRIVTPLFHGNYLLAGLAIANVSFIVGLAVFYQLMTRHYSSEQALWMGIFLITYPTAFFFHAVYSGSLFLLLFVLSLDSFYKQRLLPTAITAILAAATRLVGILLLVAYIVERFFPKRNSASKATTILLMISPLVGLGLYMAFLNYSVSDPLAFFHVQPAFGANRSTHLVLLPQVFYRYLKIFLLARFDFAYMVAVLEFSFFTLSFILSLKLLVDSYTKKHSFGLSIALISLLMILIPSLTGTFSSMPRYTLLCFSSLIVLSQISSTRVKMLIAGLFLLTQFILWPFFVQGYFIS